MPKRTFHSTLTAAFTLVSYIGTSVAPAYAYADSDASSTDSLEGYSRVEGGGFSTAGDRRGAVVGEADATPVGG